MFSATDGTISGTPTDSAAPSLHTVTATNSSGGSKATLTATVTLAVVAAPLLNLGHSSSVLQIQYGNSSLISLDSNGHWVLQAYSSGAVLASGDDACGSCNQSVGDLPPPYPPINLAGNTAIAFSSHGIEIVSANSGQLLATSQNSQCYVASGAVTGTQVIFASGSLVLAQPY